MITLLASALVAVQTVEAPLTVEAPSAVDVSDALTRRIRHALDDKRIPAISIALQDGDELVWDAAFGTAHPGIYEAHQPETPMRCASITKLFTATLVHMLAEEGKLDLDRPVREVLPEFEPKNPFKTEVTLRNILSHESGLVREPPVGHYFDMSEPSLEEMVKSLAATSLVTEPGTTYAYSNAGYGVAGRVVEVVLGEPYAGVVQKRILEPLGMERTQLGAWEPDDVSGAMWTYDSRSIPCPTFTFGYGPASNLQAPMGDLMLFARSLFRGEYEGGPQLLSEDAHRAMWAEPGSGNRAQGFRVGTDDGTLTLSHGGAVYGFASHFVVLPEEGLAVAVSSTLDMSNAVVRALTRDAIAALRARRKGKELPKPSFPRPLGKDLAWSLTGTFTSGTEHVTLRARGEELFAVPSVGRIAPIRMLRDKLVTDGPGSVGESVAGAGFGTSEPDTLFYRGREWTRDPAQTKAPPPPPKELLPLLGEYGWDHNRLIVFEDRGELTCLMEWLVFCPMDATDDPDVFRMRPRTMYSGEDVVFERDNGDVTGVRVGGCLFPRVTGFEPDTSFRIDPCHDAATLREMAAQGSPPAQPDDALEPDLVDLDSVEPSILYDVRYATTNNFMAMPFYEVAKAKLQRPAAEALARAHRALAEEYGFVTVVYDGYRPWSVTKMFYDATPDAQKVYVADPSKGSRHNRGCAIDLGLVDADSGEIIPMVSGYDEFTPKASPDYMGSTSERRWYRELLRRHMIEQGFDVYVHEWWHFDYETWRRYPILNEPLK